MNYLLCCFQVVNSCGVQIKDIRNLNVLTLPKRPCEFIPLCNCVIKQWEGLVRPRTPKREITYRQYEGAKTRMEAAS